MAKHNTGGFVIIALVALNLLLWLLFPPQDDGREYFQNQVNGEMVSTSALILMACSILLTIRPRWLEPYFGGLDKMYRVHRVIGITVAVLLIVHFIFMAILNGHFHLNPSLSKIAFIGLQLSIILALAPRIPWVGKFLNMAYHRWRVVHRLTGLFFIVGILHSIRIDNVMKFTSPVYFYVMPIALGGAALYLYEELIEPFVKKGRSYRVEAVQRLSGPAAGVTLAPRDGQINFRSGQFLVVRFPNAPGLGEPHPFTISSAPGDDRLRLTIKASGDFTRRLVDKLAVGDEARVEGGYGRFNYRAGGPRQVWVAGGIGLTPFLSWIRDFDGQPGREIDFYYSVRTPGEALFLDEIEQAQARQPGFRFFLHCSASDGHLSATKIAASSGPAAGKEVYLCGPFLMIASLKKQFLEGGVAGNCIHYEEFSFR